MINMTQEELNAIIQETRALERERIASILDTCVVHDGKHFMFREQVRAMINEE